MLPDRTTARTAGLLHLAMAVTGGFSMLYAPSLVVPGNADATALGALLLIGCLGHVLDFGTRLLLPSYTDVVSSIAGNSKFGELAMIGWLLVQGVRRQPTAV